jgi:parallel beta-helix repeat protein
LRRIASSIIITLLFLSLFVFAFTIQPAKATGPIYINPDGSITPSTANITTTDHVTYTFTGNNYLPIIVERSNIIINGNGYTLSCAGFPPSELFLVGVSNVTIKDTTIISSAMLAGVLLTRSSGDVLSGNLVVVSETSSPACGIALDYSDNNTLSDNNVTAQLYGIWLYNSFVNVLSGNNLTANYYGINLDNSSVNVLSGNNLTANSGDGIYLNYSFFNTFYHNNFVNNTQQVSSNSSFNFWDNGYPSGGNYWSDYQTRYPGASEIDGSGLWNTPYVVAANNTDYYPLMTPWTRVEARVTPVGKNVTNTYATGTVVTFSNVTSSGVTTLTAIQPPSTALTAAPNSVFVSLQTNATYHGNVTLQFRYDPAGLTLADQMAMRIWLWNTTSNAWRDITTRVNTTTDTVYGVSPHLSCFGMTCTLNSMSNGQPIQTTVQTPSAPPAGLPASLEALAYYNITATTQYTKPVTIQLVYNASAITQQQAMFLQMWLWNTTSSKWVPIPTRVDTADSMVIGVSPHLSCFGMTSLHSFPEGIAVPSAACSKTVVGRGYNVTISVQIQNQGNSAQTFTAYVYANGTAIYSEQFSNLPPKGNTTVTFNFTANLAYGNYSISACDQPIKWVRVTIPGDLNGDGTVDLTDFGILQRAWGSSPGMSNWDPRADINGDGVVDLSDFGIMQMNWGLSIP